MLSERSPMFDYISGFADQLGQGYELGWKADLPAGRYSAIILSGMGGSAIGGDLLVGYARPTMRVPFYINRQASLPKWVGQKTLVIVSSYSGNTEEARQCYAEALKRGSPVLAVCSGGRLLQLCEADKQPYVKIPGGLPPRSALGYSFAPLYAIFQRKGYIKTGAKELFGAIKQLRKLLPEYCDSAGAPARLAVSLKEKIPVFYAPGFRYEAVTVRFRCQLAENAKTLAFSNVFPELSHNEIVGWGAPASLQNHLAAVFLRAGKSQDLKTEILVRNLLYSSGIKTHYIKASGQSVLQKILSLVHYADWLSYHLAVLKGVDPVPIERIDRLKQMMKEGK